MNTQTLAANKYLKLRTGGRTILVREIQPGVGQRVERDGVKWGEMRGDTPLNRTGAVLAERRRLRNADESTLRRTRTQTEAKTQ